MKKTKNSEYVQAISKRIQIVMDFAGLEISGFATLTKLSESHIYSLLSSRRDLTDGVAATIGEKLDFDGRIIFNLNLNIPESIKKSNSLKKFRLQHKNNHEYFVDTKTDRKPAYFIKFEVLNTVFFNEPKYVWEVNDYCQKLGKKFTSDKLKKYLAYFVKKNNLQSEKRPIKRRDGTFGKRIVEVFFKDLSKKQY